MRNHLFVNPELPSQQEAVPGTCQWRVVAGTHGDARSLTYDFADVFDARQALAQVRVRFPTARVVRARPTQGD